MRGNLPPCGVARADGTARVARVHRTTTTAALLVTVAVSALTGCMTLHHPAAPGPAVTPSEPSVPRPEGRTEVQVVQAPAREALERVGPPREPGPAAPAPRRSAPVTGSGGGAQRPPAPWTRPRHRPATGPERGRRHGQPRVRIPDVEEEVRRNTDVCGLGRRYGGWRSDSPEAVACGQVYGR